MGTDAAGKKRLMWRYLDGLKPLLVDLARRIHQHPETKFIEFKASKWISEAAGKAGFRIEKPIAGLETAFRATYGSPVSPSVAFLAEYDALPKIGHACGHNLIGVAGLGAALGLQHVMSDIPGTVQLIGTPGEEGGGGKTLLAEAGVFDRLAAVMMFHPAGETVLWRYALTRQKLMTAFTGKSAHAACAPEKGINALEAVIQTFNSINALREHLSADARIHGIITHGGESPNVVPDYAAALFYIRALDDRYCDQLLERVEDCARGAALASGARLCLERQGAYKSLRENLTLAHTFKRHLESLGWVFTDADPKEKIGSTDMGDVSHIIPAIHPYVSIGSPELVDHSPEFRKAADSERGMDAMLAAAKAMAATGLDLFTKSRLLEAVSAEFAGAAGKSTL